MALNSARRKSSMSGSPTVFNGPASEICAFNSASEESETAGARFGPAQGIRQPGGANRMSQTDTGCFMVGGSGRSWSAAL